MDEGRLIAQVLDKAELVWDKTYLDITLPKDQFIVVWDELCQAFEGLGYSSDLEKQELGDRVVVSLSNDAAKWSVNRRLYFYSSLEDFWASFTNSPNSESFYYITCTKDTNIPGFATTLSKQVECYVVWRKVLELLVDHVGTRASMNEFIYFISGEKSAKKYQVNPAISLSEFQEGFVVDLHSTAKSMLEHLELDDAHQLERKAVMRTALADILGEDHTGSPFIWIVSQGLKFFNIYREHYDNYTHRFSVNKLLSEIEEKNLEYSNKINDFIAGIQTKAFALPGVLVGIAALVRSAGMAEIGLICIGLLMVRSLTKTANDIYFDSFDNLLLSVSEGFKKYRKSEIAEEVRESACLTQIKIEELISKAKDRLNYIDKISYAMLVSGFVYLAYKIYASPSETLVKVFFVNLWADYLEVIIFAKLLMVLAFEQFVKFVS